MGRVMKCRHCDEDLVCAACGERQTPRKKKATTVTFTDEELADIDEKAEAAGMNRSEYLASLAAKDEGDG